MIKKEMEIKIVFGEVWRTGRGRQIIVAKCNSRNDKEKIMKNKKKLKGSRIFIENDLT